MWRVSSHAFQLRPALWEVLCWVWYSNQIWITVPLTRNLRHLTRLGSPLLTLSIHRILLWSWPNDSRLFTADRLLQPLPRPLFLGESLPATITRQRALCVSVKHICGCKTRDDKSSQGSYFVKNVCSCKCSCYKSACRVVVELGKAIRLHS